MQFWTQSVVSWARRVSLVLAALALVAEARGQLINQAVGGVYVDAEGVVSAPPVVEDQNLQAIWQAGLDPAPAELAPMTELRFVSLKKLEQQIADAQASGEPLPDAVRYLAGLLRVKYVLAYPPAEGETTGDIVLAGPAEGWRVDSLGNVVGLTTGRPVLLLDDLVVALRAAESSNGPGISCSIDPTQEGLARAQQVQRELPAGVSPQTASQQLEQALGQQVISVTGVPASSHFARTLVAADFRMKRLAMGFEPSEVAGVTSYLQVVNTRRVSGSLLPRWWLTTDYEPLARDAEGLAWEVRGQGVKCMAEEDFVDASGEVQRNRGAAGDARRWAEMMTDSYEDLANHDSAFGQLRNALDLSVAAALLTKEGLWEVAGVEVPQLAGDYQPQQYDAPRSVATKATFLKRGSKWVVTASGGVQVFPWLVADQSVESKDLEPLRAQATASQGEQWWWQ